MFTRRKRFSSCRPRTMLADESMRRNCRGPVHTKNLVSGPSGKRESQADDVSEAVRLLSLQVISSAFIRLRLRAACVRATSPLSCPDSALVSHGLVFVLFRPVESSCSRLPPPSTALIRGGGAAFAAPATTLRGLRRDKGPGNFKKHNADGVPWRHRPRPPRTLTD